MGSGWQVTFNHWSPYLSTHSFIASDSHQPNHSHSMLCLLFFPPQGLYLLRGVTMPSLNYRCCQCYRLKTMALKGLIGSQGSSFTGVNKDLKGDSGSIPFSCPSVACGHSTPSRWRIHKMPPWSANLTRHPDSTLISDYTACTSKRK